MYISTKKTLGDGCSVCNPQMVIDMLLEEKQELEQRIKELESPRTCGTCIYMEQQGEDYFVCNCTEFQTCTTPSTICFIGYKPKEDTE